MSWAKLDDRYDDNRKIKRAWKRNPRAVGIHAMAITYSSRHNTDGRIDIDWLEDRLPKQSDRDKTIAVLVDTGLFDVIDEETWQVHDYLEYNASKEGREEQSHAAREAARVRWAKAEEAKRIAAEEAQRNAEADAERIADCNADRIPERNADAMRDPMLPPARPGPYEEQQTALSDASDLDAARARLKTSTEQQVFDAWIEATGRTGATVFSDKRRRLIRNALKLYSTADVLDAVQGWRKSSHHCGENPSGTVYNDLELLLRDAAHIEKFRDLHRNGNGSAPEPRGDGFGERLNAKAIR